MPYWGVRASWPSAVASPKENSSTNAEKNNPPLWKRLPSRAGQVWAQSVDQATDTARLQSSVLPWTSGLYHSHSLSAHIPDFLALDAPHRWRAAIRLRGATPAAIDFISLT